ALPTRARTEGSEFSSIFQFPLVLGPELARDVEHGLDDLLVSRAAAEVAFDALFYLGDAGLRVLPQEFADRHHHAARAIAALDGVVLVEGGLDGGELPAFGFALDGLDLGSIGLD